ncbi:hypothetical protein IGI04_035137 [Brassica rapa subsp. trilocularis]|uniref:Remorin C-terminal domain-containing protein n=1 Tax=Brassica rapa subsp. trilocularis TaxID=1813537 RepID=A0ABQ7LBR2_BRACM|nr:hypothetical protein IGI04_035137 [Brassica rapa subsp. trilocularis]
MGTEMTRIAFQEPSKNGTPLMLITPMQSPMSYAPSSPGTQASELSKKELQMKTRREIKTKAFLQTCKTVSEARASLREKVEKANHMARSRFRWENNQKVEVEKVKGRLHDRLMKRLSAVECKAEEK